MALIDRTIYPRFKEKITTKLIEKLYTPSDEEIKFAYSQVKGAEQICVFLIMMKSFENLSYFPIYKDIPNNIINHIKNIVSYNQPVIEFKERSLKRYGANIRSYLGILNNLQTIKYLIIKAVEEFEPILENPADVFNAVIEILIKNNCELPAFSTLERVINAKRAEINNNIFKDIESKLTEYDKKSLDLLLNVDENGKSIFNYIKELPNVLRPNC